MISHFKEINLLNRVCVWRIDRRVLCLAILSGASPLQTRQYQTDLIKLANTIKTSNRGLLHSIDESLDSSLLSLAHIDIGSLKGRSPTQYANNKLPINTISIQHNTKWAYLAGFLDGDGSIMAQIIPRPDYILKYQIRVSLSFIQITKRKHFLIKIQNEIKKGNIRDRGDGISELTLIGWQDVKWILSQMKPFLRIKEKEANLVLKIIEQFPLTKRSPDNFLKICELADQVANLNDSKRCTIITKVVRQRFQDLKLIEEL